MADTDDMVMNVGRKRTKISQVPQRSGVCTSNEQESAPSPLPVPSLRGTGSPLSGGSSPPSRVTHWLCCYLPLLVPRPTEDSATIATVSDTVPRVDIRRNCQAFTDCLLFLP